jgi:two-component system LytT family response regulator
MKIKVVLVDDLPDFLTVLTIMLKELNYDIDIIGTANNMDEAVSLIKINKPDIVFMDIQMGKHSGFEILNECKNFFNFVVFTTSHKEFALDAYKYNVLNYLLKPLEPLKLEQCFVKYTDLVGNKTISSDLEKSLLKVLNLKNEKLFLYENNEQHAIDLDCLLYVESNGSYTLYHTLDKVITLSKNLSYAANLLERHAQFIRIHRFYIVNKHHITNIKKGIQCSVILNGNIEIPISLQEKSSLFKLLGV